jgi:hypothetical protein
MFSHGSLLNRLPSILTRLFQILQTTMIKAYFWQNPSYVVDGHQLNTALIAALKFLQTNPKIAEQETFRKCPQRTLQEVRNQVKFMERDGIHYGVYSAAKDVLRFFLPLDFEAHIVLKFWGGVSEIIKNLVSVELFLLNVQGLTYG